MANTNSINKIVAKFARSTIVTGHWVLNAVLRAHPDLEDSDDVADLRKHLKDLEEVEIELSKEVDTNG